MFYGVLVHKFEIPPYHLLKAGYEILQSKEYTEVPKEYTQTDIASLISIKKHSDVLERREALLHFFWGESKLPLLLPSTIIENFKDVRYDDIGSLYRIDKIVIKMEFEIESVVYHFIPKDSNNKVILYHQGHRGDFYNSKEQIKTFIEKGYSVMAFSMPLLGLNNQPIVQLPRFGKLKLTSHDHMKFLLPKDGHPIKFFIEPVIIALNYLENNFDYISVAMCGISGGGWTTTLVAAVDTRIKTSFPLAGSYPIYLRSNSINDWGDYEQNAPELYRIANYLELYILGGYGKGRKQLQIINKYDSCCFSGLKWKTYRDIIRAHMDQLGVGDFDLLLDDSHRKHIVSNFAMSQILNEIEND